MTPSIKNIAIGLLILTAVFFIIEHGFGKKKGKPFLRRQWFTDLCWYFFVPLVGKQVSKLVFILPATILIGAGLAVGADFKNGTYDGFGPLGAQPVWLQIIQIYVINDFFSYWSHRLFHRGRWWKFHAVHHSSEDLDWLSSIRVHPVNELVTKFFQVTPLLLLGYNPLVTGSAPLILTMYALLLHANVDWTFGPLKYVIATPVFHRWHHSRDKEAWDKNFAGLFPFWDILFGTFYMPKDRVPEDFGINDPMPEGIVGQLIQPFRKG